MVVDFKVFLFFAGSGMGIFVLNLFLSDHWFKNTKIK